ncbi:efflux RND transporter permease subunit [Nevskia ramosa]|uniref:efflux RND transporter permease subunit n=1 Tax=Nevskia ramosa TaxID=64002 RepID=UPI002356F776|nr:efflux RND transporter permease subunit [Nevskia ramosa]
MNQPGSEGGFNLSRWAIEHASFTRFIVVLLMISGVFAYLNLGQKEDPEFTFRIMVVRAYWPGATAAEMEQQVTDRIEEKLEETPWLDRTQSYSKPGETQVFVFLREDTPPKDVRNVWYQVRKKVGDVQGQLPQGVQGPFFNDEFGDTYIAMYAFHAEGFTYVELKDYVDTARKVFGAVKGVEKVDLLGEQQPKVFVEFSYRKFAQLGITFQQLSEALRGQNIVVPSGQLNTEERALFVRVDGTYGDLAAIEDTRFRVGRSTFRLGDFAKVYRGYEDPPRMKIRHRGKETIALGIVMEKDSDVLKVGEQLDSTLARLRSSFPVGIEVNQITDQPKVVKSAVGEFVQSLAEAVVIVLVVSFFSLGLRTGMVVALTIPFVLGVTFLAMDWAGIQLQKISLGALVLALGLLVDDAMIAVEMMARKLEEGYDKLKAASFAYTSTAFPMLTGTLITAAGFLPVGFAKSAAGEYTFSIFAVVGMALVISWIASVYVTPWLGMMLLKERPAGEHHELFDTPFYRRLRRVIDWCVAQRKTVMIATFAAFVLGVASFAVIPQQFFPDSTRDELMVDLWLPEGASYLASENIAKRMEAKLAADPDVVDYVAYVGNGAPRFYLALDQQLAHVNFTQFMVVAHDLKGRERLRARLRTWIAEEFPEVRGRVDPLPNGPPVGWPVQFRVQGPDPKLVRHYADQVKAIIAASPMTRNVHDNWHESILVVQDRIDQDKLRVLGITSEQIRGAGQTILSGSVIGTYREANRNVEIIARQPLDERSRISDLADAYMPTASGVSVPFSQFGKAQPSFEPGVLWRYSRLPAITIQAETVPGKQAPDVTNSIDPQLDALRAQLPVGYAISIAGALEQSKIANDSINAQMPMMLVVIVVLLMIQLQHFGRTVMVLLTAPLGIIGAAAALLVTGLPFGFVALLGVIALAGIIMRNSVILVDQIDQDIQGGHDPWTAIVESAVRRFRPIVLTAAAAVLALIPLVRSTFFGPMAAALMGGLIVATVLTMTFLPALYAAWFRVRRPA